MEFSFQLYCARNFQPILDILPKLKSMGYAQVEGFGGLYADHPELADAIKSAGLTMPTGHFGLDTLEDTKGTIELAEKLGTKILLCPAVGPEERSQGEAGWQALAAKLADLAETYANAGLTLGWHNHDFEFVATENGRLPIEIILDEAPKLVWEHDIAWTIRGGHDPLDWIKRYGDRTVAVHVKDIAPAGENVDEDGWADVGHGTVDWATLLKAVKAQTKAEYFVMEHDNPSDVERFARRSIETVKSFGA